MLFQVIMAKSLCIPRKSAHVHKVASYLVLYPTKGDKHVDRLEILHQGEKQLWNNDGLFINKNSSICNSTSCNYDKHKTRVQPWTTKKHETYKVLQKKTIYQQVAPKGNTHPEFDKKEHRLWPFVVQFF